MFKSTTTNIVAILTLILLIVELRFCDYLFPWTGLQAIIIVPIIYILGIGIILLGMRVSRNLTLPYFILTWSIIATITTILTVNMYPQEYRPPVTDQIKYTYQVVDNFESITERDLRLYELDNFNRYDSSVRDSRERYVAALY